MDGNFGYGVSKSGVNRLSHCVGVTVEYSAANIRAKRTIGNNRQGSH